MNYQEHEEIESEYYQKVYSKLENIQRYQNIISEITERNLLDFATKQNDTMDIYLSRLWKMLYTLSTQDDTEKTKAPSPPEILAWDLLICLWTLKRLKEK